MSENPGRIRRLIWTALLCGIVFTFALAIALHQKTKKPGTLPVYGAVPDFSLVQQNGKPLTKKELLGHIWIADFIFSRCAGQCPLLSTIVSGLQADFAGQEGLRFVSFSVDPGFDTPAVLAKYAQTYHADPARWMFVTGDKEAMFDLARKGFKVGVGSHSPDGSDYSKEPIFHSAYLILVDIQGNIRSYYDAMDNEAVARLRKDIQKLSQQRTP